MKVKVKVTVVVPVYNAAKYLNQAVKSLQNQTHKNLEIILVDDYSTDNSLKIAKDFAKYDKRIKVFQTRENSGGPLRGREIGIEKSTGEWITFIDCDDFVEPKYVEHLLLTTENGKFDIAVTGHQRYFSGGRRKNFLWEDYSQTSNARLTSFYKHFLGEDFWTDPTDTAGQNLVRAGVAKKAAREILSKQPNRLWAEDTFMAAAFLACSENGVNFRDFHDFNWRQRMGSGSHGGFSSTADREAFYNGMHKIFTENYDRFLPNLPLISVIVPIYNVKKYLKDCVVSILNQTYKKVEIILIDDGSQDESIEICDEFARRDARIKAFHKKNQGLNYARKTGFEKSHGEFIAFVDGDDLLPRNALKTLYETLLAQDVDIVIAGYKSFSSKTDLKLEKDTDKAHTKTLRDKTQILKYYLTRENLGFQNIYQVVAWGRLFRRKIIAKTDWGFANYQISEDEFESLQWFNFAESIAVRNDSLYFYRQNPESKMRTEYKNRTPSGKNINRFEFADILLNASERYLKNEGLSEDLMWRFEIMNRVFFDKNVCEKKISLDEMKSFSKNFRRILEMRNNATQVLYENIKNLKNTNQEILRSKTWKAGKIIQKAATIPQKITKGIFLRK